ncbi:probable LRR receptor-like serine/threonine-protein kinase At3g47570 [Gossypium hirsutum]|uniref:Probable LRR receptor-like serine/threonine-protein kinase At3g47570 n=1 Tax=Gossypium hirsutum TaxID=3635 RepID=A0ABM2ZZP1_GOSHI|nr:probable LRR receptor-like serine/threonine-protein kinase At3g47570 [Gossypium hirsutum]
MNTYAFGATQFVRRPKTDLPKLERASRNKLIGNILVELGKLVKLENLEIAHDNLTGHLPTSLGNVSTLQDINLEGNYLEGGLQVTLGFLKSLPVSLGYSLPNLRGIHIGGENHITGTIPLGIVNLVNLIGIGLAENRLTGTIPDSLGMLKKLQTLYLGGKRDLNCGCGHVFGCVAFIVVVDKTDAIAVTADIGNLVNLVYLNISSNNFSGHIPAALSDCTTLETLSLGENHFDGSIPDSLSSLRSIAELDLSSNNLSGQIPDYLEKLSFLKYLNLSHNRFEGPVPTKGVFNNASAVSLTRNGRLCGGIAELHLPSCPFTHPKDPKTSIPFKLIWIVCGVLGILMLSSLLFCWLRKRGVKAKPSLAFRLGNSIMMVSFHQLLKATDGFAPANLIGQGSFGNVYKGILYQNQEQNVIAVKVMNLQEQGASRSSLTECKTLRNVRHRNLVKIISACSSIDFQGNPFKALIYEFIPNGSYINGYIIPSNTENQRS